MKNFAQKFIVLVAAMVALSVYQQRAQAATCTIGFDQGWNSVYLNAKDTFARPTRFVNGQFAACASPLPTTDTGSCWDYRQSCVSGKVFTVFPQQYGHFHASFEDPTINCLNFQSGGMGRKVGTGPCVNAAWVSEPRMLQSHVATHWIEISHKNFSGVSQGFSMVSIGVSDGPIKFQFMRPDGTMAGWDNLAPGTNWLIPTGPIVTAWFSGASGSQVGFTVDNFVANTN